MKNENNSGWAVIFDVDGTMVDNASFHENAWIEFGKLHNLPITPEFYRKNIHSKSNDKIICSLFEDADPEQAEQIAEEKEDIYRRTFKPHIREIPGLITLLKQLEKLGVPCAAASNSPKGNVDLVLDELGVSRYFQAVTHRQEVSRGKPDPTIFLITAEKLNMPPERCVVLEDSISGFKAADAANMPCVAITSAADPDCIANAYLAKQMHNDFTTLTPNILKSLVFQKVKS